LYPTKNIGVDIEAAPETSLYFRDPLVKLFYDNLLKLDEVRYQQSDNFNLYNSLIRKYTTEKKPIIFSEERATSVFFTHSDIGLKAKRIYELMPGGKIIIVIRNQSDALKSMYADFPFDPRSPATGESMNINKWLDVVLTDELLRYRETLDYCSVIKFYEVLFGKSNVCVLLFEELVNDKEAFAKKISAFLDVSASETHALLSEAHENLRVSHKYNVLRTVKRKYFRNIHLSKFLGKSLVSQFTLFLKQFRSAEYSFDLARVANINKYYSASNERLVKEYNLKVNDYGYPIDRLEK